jgi:hypothetical protein
MSQANGFIGDGPTPLTEITKDEDTRESTKKKKTPTYLKGVLRFLLWIERSKSKDLKAGRWI